MQMPCNAMQVQTVCVCSCITFQHLLFFWGKMHALAHSQTLPVKCSLKAFQIEWVRIVHIILIHYNNLWGTNAPFNIVSLLHRVYKYKMERTHAWRNISQSFDTILGDTAFVSLCFAILSLITHISEYCGNQSICLRKRVCLCLCARAKLNQFHYQTIYIYIYLA